MIPTAKDINRPVIVQVDGDRHIFNISGITENRGFEVWLVDIGTSPRKRVAPDRKVRIGTIWFDVDAGMPKCVVLVPEHVFSREQHALSYEDYLGGAPNTRVRRILEWAKLQHLEDL